MKRTIKIVLFAVALAVLASLPGILPGFRPLVELQSVVKAANKNILTFDVACDCRMGSPAFFRGNRGDAWIVSGKIFPAGTLPAGTATNDPTLPVRGVAPIGEWTCRGQSALPFPPAVAAAYNATPFAFNTQYFILNNGSALTVEGYAIPTGERLSVTGGIGGFSGPAVSRRRAIRQMPPDVRTSAPSSISSLALCIKRAALAQPINDAQPQYFAVAESLPEPMTQRLRNKYHQDAKTRKNTKSLSRGASSRLRG